MPGNTAYLCTGIPVLQHLTTQQDVDGSNPAIDTTSINNVSGPRYWKRKSMVKILEN